MVQAACVETAASGCTGSHANRWVLFASSVVLQLSAAAEILLQGDVCGVCGCDGCSMVCVGGWGVGVTQLVGVCGCCVLSWCVAAVCYHDAAGNWPLVLQRHDRNYGAIMLWLIGV